MRPDSAVGPIWTDDAEPIDIETLDAPASGAAGFDALFELDDIRAYAGRSLTIHEVRAARAHAHAPNVSAAHTPPPTQGPTSASPTVAKAVCGVAHPDQCIGCGCPNACPSAGGLAGSGAVATVFAVLLVGAAVGALWHLRGGALRGGHPPPPPMRLEEVDEAADGGVEMEPPPRV